MFAAKNKEEDFRMRHLSNSVLVLLISGGCLLFVLDRVLAKPDVRQALVEKNAKMTNTFQCEKGSYLVSLSTATEGSDRMLGLATGCVKADTTPGKDGAWIGAPAIVDRIGKPSTIGSIRSCENGSYIVGLGFSLGSYRANFYDPVVPANLLADLQPVCRNAATGISAVLPAATLTGAEDNNIRNTQWDSIGGPKSCPEGYAVTAVSVQFDNSKIGNMFSDAQITCDALTINGVPNFKAEKVSQGSDPRRFRPASPDPSLEAYTDPKSSAGVPIGYCLVAGNTTTCGKPAADAFCSSQNHQRASQFSQVPKVVSETTSLNPGQENCHGQCKALDSVVCLRQGY
jgi:hypothetical protein